MYLSLNPDKIILSVKFSFSTNGNRSVLYIFCLSGFCCELFLIHDESDIGLNVEFSNKSRYNGKCCKLFIFALSRSVFTACVSSACLKSLQFKEIRFILFVPLCDCNNAAPISKLEASHIA